MPAGAGFEWLREGWASFAAYPGQWVGITAITGVISLCLMVVPFIGQLALYMLLPILIAGMLQVCLNIRGDEHPHIRDLFVAFKGDVSQLVITGLLNLAATFAIGLMLSVIAQGSALSGIFLGAPGLLGLGAVMGGMMVSGLFAVVLLTLLMMALWFAPALVFFHNMKAWPALKASFEACARNWLAFFVFGLISLIMLFFALLPLGLGLFVVIPILVGSLYAAYCDIFVAR